MSKITREQQEIDQEIRERLAEYGYNIPHLKTKVPVAFQHKGVDYYLYDTPTIEEHCHYQESIDKLRGEGITHIKRYCCEYKVNWYNRYVDANGTIISEEEC